MRLMKVWWDTHGTTAVEFALIAPAFILVLFGIIEIGLLLWTQIGLQHGAEMAARCASVNKTLCGNANDISSYAAQQAFGLNFPASTFVVSAPPCGNQVSANYPYRFLELFSSTTLTLNAQACFPK